jgi:serine/threonine protein kinase
LLQKFYKLRFAANIQTNPKQKANYPQKFENSNFLNTNKKMLSKAPHLLNNPQSKANDVLKQDNKNIESKYKKIKVLKEGGFGKAFLCSKVGDQALCVIKEMKTKSLTEREINEMKREAEILKVLKHPNVIRLREFYMNSRNKFCIVMDYAEKGDLASKLDKTETFFSENQILEWFVQLCLALKHIHDRKIVHRD